jgi:hypothetical protein
VTERSAPLRRAYSLHGIEIEVQADDEAVIASMDLRLRGTASGDATAGASPVRFEFVAGDLPTDAGRSARPVYDTPHGSLFYREQDDTLAGVLGGVSLRCAVAEGRVLLTAPAFRSHHLYFATHPVTTVALMELMKRRGRFSLHAGCVAGPDDSGVLLAGPSGAGKSTLTLALARTGLGFLSDDVVFLERPPGSEAIRALGFPDALGLAPFAAQRFPELRRWLDAPPADGFPKRLHRVEDLLGGAPVSSCIPRSIVFPEVTPTRKSELIPLDGGEALVRLVPDVLLTDPRATADHLAAIADLLGRVECYLLRTGSDLERAAERVTALTAPLRRPSVAECPAAGGVRETRRNGVDLELEPAGARSRDGV